MGRTAFQGPRFAAFPAVGGRVGDAEIGKNGEQFRRDRRHGGEHTILIPNVVLRQQRIALAGAG